VAAALHVVRWQGGYRLAGVALMDAAEGAAVKIGVAGVSSVHKNLVPGATYVVGPNASIVPGWPLLSSLVVGKAVSSSELVLSHSAWSCRNCIDAHSRSARHSPNSLSRFFLLPKLSAIFSGLVLKRRMLDRTYFAFAIRGSDALASPCLTADLARSPSVPFDSAASNYESSSLFCFMKNNLD